jgi:hypothetical protein
MKWRQSMDFLFMSYQEHHISVVMPALVAGIHDFLGSKTWMAGTSPAVTVLQ